MGRSLSLGGTRALPVRRRSGAEPLLADLTPWAKLSNTAKAPKPPCRTVTAQEEDVPWPPATSPTAGYLSLVPASPRAVGRFFRGHFLVSLRFPPQDF